MEAKWPFLVLTCTLLLALGVMIVNLDRVHVMNQWSTRRCELPVMFTSYFFKPEEDPRSKSEFASANFEFCMKSYVDTFMTSMMAPVTALFSKHLSVAGSSMNMMNILRNIAHTLYGAFSTYLDQFYRRFNASVFQISRVMQFLRMAMKRISGIMMSLIYSGLSIFNGIINTIQFIVKVILIICAIMLAIIIILFFILFPLIPLIIYVLVLIVQTVSKLSGIMDPGIAADANSKKSGFCFAEWTTVAITRNGTTTQKLVSEIQIGDQLADGAYVTAVITMDGSHVELYQINNVFVSGSHLIKGTDHEWKSVDMDERAVLSTRTSSSVFCFNTTTNVVTIDGLQFRDWEEIANDDTKGQMIWNYTISSMLNKGKPFRVWKDNMKDYVNIAVMGRDVGVKTPKGFVPIHTIQIGDNVIDTDGIAHCVRGIIKGEVECNKSALQDDAWVTELYEYVDGVWLKGSASVEPGTDKMEGITLITEHGEFIIWDSVKKTETRVRDFTEVGYHAIYKTYPYVGARLRMKE